MVAIKNAAESDVQLEAEMTERVKLDAGQIIENIELLSARKAVSDYGDFMALTFKDENGEKFHFVCGTSNVWGRNCIEKFADTDAEGNYSLKERFIGKKIWVMKDNPRKPKKGGKPYMAAKAGFMDGGEV